MTPLPTPTRRARTTSDVQPWTPWLRMTMWLIQTGLLGGLFSIAYNIAWTLRDDHAKLERVDYAVSAQTRALIAIAGHLIEKGGDRGAYDKVMMELHPAPITEKN